MGKIISVIEASRRLGVTGQTLRNWIKKGAISTNKIGGSCYIDEDTVAALQATAQDIERDRKAIEAIYREQHEEYMTCARERQDEKTRKRYMNLLHGAAFRSGFYTVMVRLMNSHGVINYREMNVLSEFLHGQTIDEIADRYKLSRERIRQVAEKAIRKSICLTTIDEKLEKANALESENKNLRKAVSLLKEKIRRYEEYKEPNEEEKAENETLCELLSKKLIDCPLSVRALNCLRAGRMVREFNFDKIETRIIVPECNTVGDLCRLHETDVMNLRNFGKKTLKEINDFFSANNLTWGMDVDGIFEKQTLISSFMKPE